MVFAFVRSLLGQKRPRDEAPAEDIPAAAAAVCWQANQDGTAAVAVAAPAKTVRRRTRKVRPRRASASSSSASSASSEGHDVGHGSSSAETAAPLRFSPRGRSSGVAEKAATRGGDALLADAAAAAAGPSELAFSPRTRVAAPRCRVRKTLILDLDETLVHSAFRAVPGKTCDVVVNIMADSTPCSFHVFKRPHVDEFLAQVCRWYEVVVFTASLQRYADPVINHLDPHKRIRRRFFRESCVQVNGNYVKDLRRLGQALEHTIIIDNSPVAYPNDKENAVPIVGWFDDEEDTALLELLPVLELARHLHDVRSLLSLRTRGGGAAAASLGK